jgi:hypothetical protein
MLNRSFCFYIVVGMALIIAGCSKQSSPHYQEQLRVTADEQYQRMTTKYSYEIALLDGDREPEKIKAKLEDLVLRKPFKKQSALSVFLIGDDPRSAEKIPFHAYVQELENDLKELRSVRRGLIRNSVSSAEVLQKIDNMQVLIDRLYELKAYATSHREFRDEERYLRLVPR